MTRVKILAWALWLAFLVVLVMATYLGFNPPRGRPINVADAIWAASFIGFPTAGALVVSRLPRRPLGWILLVAPLLLMTGVALSDASRMLVAGAPEPVMLWLASVCFGGGLAPLLTVPLYLPDGRLPSPRWRWVARAVWSLALLALLTSALRPGPLESAASGQMNPFGIEPLRGFFDAIEAALGPAFLLTIAVGVVAMILRFRRAQGIERQQMKWLVLGGVILLGSFGSIAVYQALFHDLSDVVVTLIIVVAILSLPTAIAIAVLKTRLYEIDVVINRALVYTALTGILGFAYLGLVVVLRDVLGPLTRESDLAVAGSTLAVAALFRPVRARVQSFIDQRFYRRKYDAAETLGEFSTRLRDQVDLDSLTTELVSVVGSTMQPAHASVWLREAPE